MSTREATRPTLGRCHYTTPALRNPHATPQVTIEPEPPSEAPQRVPPPVSPPIGNRPPKVVDHDGAEPAPGATPAPEGFPLGRFGRRLLKLLGADAAGEARDLTELAGRIQQPLTMPRRIAVTSVRGGVPQATVTVLAAAAMARFRHDRVLVIDAHPAPGGVAGRLGVDADSALLALVRDSAPSSFEDAEKHLVRSGSFWVLPAGDAITLDRSVYQSAIARLTRFFAITLINCPAGWTPFVRDVLADSHAHLVDVPATGTWSGGSAAAEPGAIKVVTAVTPGERTSNPPAEAVQVPYDEHLSAGRTFDVGKIAESTHAAAIRLAAEAVTRATNRGRS